MDILRQPADRAYSDYVYRIQRGWETENSFTEALELEDSRRAKGWPGMFFTLKMVVTIRNYPPITNGFYVKKSYASRISSDEICHTG
ncbi:MAG: hypothetical protein HW390_1527 [Candidatus Brocadiaceae bacterium]|nr:hypothetical protein [Candidatus Brocadiaceae bacterium]